MDRLLLLVTAAAMYPAQILPKDRLLEVTDAIVMAPAAEKKR